MEGIFSETLSVAVGHSKTSHHPDRTQERTVEGGASLWWAAVHLTFCVTPLYPPEPLFMAPGLPLSSDTGQLPCDAVAVTIPSLGVVPVAKVLDVFLSVIELLLGTTGMLGATF